MKNIKQHRHHRVRARLTGTGDRPRLAVARSLKHISAQVIDDATRQTICAAADHELTAKDLTSLPPVEVAKLVGKLVASKAKDKKISQVVFDRGGYAYHGRIQALADGAREGGLEF
ncbi:MAG: 50S ribosomal protein L18 [Candidatus Kerfeldbacteria bacterium]|nr:50S ribosomal protein L18 [Candidatus Kerfeldbacteria bacterium]